MKKSLALMYWLVAVMRRSSGREGRAATAAQAVSPPQIDLVNDDSGLPVGRTDGTRGPVSAEPSQRTCPRIGSAVPAVGAVDRLEEAAQPHAGLELLALNHQGRRTAVVHLVIHVRGIVG